MIVLVAICVISIVLAAAGWVCDRLDRRDGLEQERRRRQALRRCVQRARQTQ